MNAAAISNSALFSGYKFYHNQYAEPASSDLLVQLHFVSMALYSCTDLSIIALVTSTLAEHYNKHGKSIGFQDKYSYEAHAVHFANTIDRKNCISFKDSRGSTYKYNVKTNELAIITKKGIVVTYFKPKEGKKYYDSQKRSKGKHGKKV